MRFSIEEYLRGEDIDASGIIYYQAYLRFFGLAEAELYRSCGLSYREMFEEVGVWLPRVHVECDFHHPVVLDDLLVVEAWFGKIGTTSIHIDFEVRRKENPDQVVDIGKYIVVAENKGEIAHTPVTLTFIATVCGYGVAVTT